MFKSRAKAGHVACRSAFSVNHVVTRHDPFQVRPSASAPAGAPEPPGCDAPLDLRSPLGAESESYDLDLTASEFLAE